MICWHSLRRQVRRTTIDPRLRGGRPPRSPFIRSTGADRAALLIGVAYNADLNQIRQVSGAADDAVAGPLDAPGLQAVLLELADSPAS